MAQKPTPSPAKPMADAERTHADCLAWLLKCAVQVGAKEPGAVTKAKNARQQYEAAVVELRRSERARGRTGSINWIHSQVGNMRHSDAAKGQDTADWPKVLSDALASLEKAVW